VSVCLPDAVIVSRRLLVLTGGRHGSEIGNPVSQTRVALAEEAQGAASHVECTL